MQNLTRLKLAALVELQIAAIRHRAQQLAANKNLSRERRAAMDMAVQAAKRALMEASATTERIETALTH